MRVYVVEQYDEEGSIVISAFSTMGKAINAIELYEKEDEEEGNEYGYSITTLRIDKEERGDKK